mmetsp:Transcript_20621/g.42221  ORF Transcript_20621/g.42221 Transcript_20621/m.42221 type:complete len:209 (+) Transcript_20621:250-876(+)
MARAFDRRCFGRTARLIVPRLRALQRDPVRNSRVGRVPGVVGVGDSKVLHRPHTLAPVEEGVEQGLLRAVNNIAKDVGWLTSSASDQGVEGSVRRLDEHDSCVEPLTTEPMLGGESFEAEQAVGRPEQHGVSGDVQQLLVLHELPQPQLRGLVAPSRVLVGVVRPAPRMPPPPELLHLVYHHHLEPSFTKQLVPRSWNSGGDQDQQLP